MPGGCPEEELERGGWSLWGRCLVGTSRGSTLHPPEKGDSRLLLLTCGFTGTAAGIPARKIKPVLINNSDSRCLELKIRSCWLPFCVGIEELSSWGQISGLPQVSPSFTLFLFPTFLWRWSDLLWHSHIPRAEPKCCWKCAALCCSSPGGSESNSFVPSWGFFRCRQSSNKTWPLSSCSASVFVSPAVLAPAPSWHRGCHTGRCWMPTQPQFPALAPQQQHRRKELGWGPAVLGARSTLMQGQSALACRSRDQCHGFGPTGAFWSL